MSHLKPGAQCPPDAAPCTALSLGHNTGTLGRKLRRADVRAEIKATWPWIVEVARTGGVSPALCDKASESLPLSPTIMGTSTKVEKGSQGYTVAVVYLAGARMWRLLCQDSTPACRAACLGHTTGHLAMDNGGRKPQAWKTALLVGAPDLFRELIRFELTALGARASRSGTIGALRVDGSSDSGLARELVDDAARAGVQLYDYTKSIGRAQAALGTPWSVTLSYPGGDTPWEPYRAHIMDGGLVAVVADIPKGTPVPARWSGFRTVDGDKSDLRFLDKPGTVVVLRLKGHNRAKAAARAGGFVAYKLEPTGPGSYGDTR